MAAITTYTGVGNNPYEVELPTAQYTSALELLLQQKISKLRGLFSSGGHVGKMASPVNQIGYLEFKQPQARYAPIHFQIPNYTRRWVFPNDREVGVPVDQFDELKTIVNPTSGITMAVVAAANRFFDDLLIGAAFASASTGVDASSLQTEAWPATTYVVADTFGNGTSVGLTYDKVIEAKRILRHYQNDLEADMACMIIGSQQEADLLRQAEIIDKQFNDAPVVESGTVTKIAGFSVHVTERLQTTSSNSLRQCIVAVQSALYLGLWKDMSTDITQRTDLSGHPWQLYSMISAGATRTQLGKIVEVDCADTTGADPTSP
jgi:hypothetical protein